MLAKIEMSTSGLIAADRSPMCFTTPRQWMALVAKHAKEQEAADWLKRDRYYAYWPCYMKLENAGGSKHKGHWRTRGRYTAIMPGLIFVACAYGSTFHPQPLVDWVPGLISYMRNGAGHPAVLDNEDIETIRRIEGDQNLPKDRRAHKFKPGDKVRFVDDLLGRWPAGTITRLAEDGRIVVDVALLGRFVPITVEPHQIEMM